MKTPQQNGLDAERRVRGFFEAYRAAFERYDAPAIADLFTYPAHVTTDSGEVELFPVAAREPWIEQLTRLLSLYRAIEVASARVLELEVRELSPRLLAAVVSWELADRRGAVLYAFQAAYTLVETDGALRISAIAHNEVLHYRDCVARLRADGRDEASGPDHDTPAPKR